jgi:hypothetical protein
VTDPRNIAHDKKVQQEKKHHRKENAAGAAHSVQPGRTPHLEPVEKPEQVEITPPPPDSPKEQMQG